MKQRHSLVRPETLGKIPPSVAEGRNTNHMNIFLKQLEFISVLAVSLLGLAGCTTVVPLNYSPSSVLSASGSVSVSDFQYLPAISGRIKPNQIRNTAISTPDFDQEINVFFRDAVFKELRFVGVKLDNKARVLNGEIKDFLIDDLGFNVDWSLNVLYRVKASDKILYEFESITKRRTTKFANTFGALNEVIKLNIDEIIKDPAFIKAIND